MAGQASAEPVCSLREECHQVAGLDSYLKQPGSELALPSQPAEREHLRGCLRDVRSANTILLAGSKPGCPIADDQAFKMIMKLGQEEVREHLAQKAKSVDDIVFEDKPCFGTLCWQTEKGWAGRYHPNQSAQGAQ